MNTFRYNNILVLVLYFPVTIKLSLGHMMITNLVYRKTINIYFYLVNLEIMLVNKTTLVHPIILTYVLLLFFTVTICLNYERMFNNKKQDKAAQIQTINV